MRRISIDILKELGFKEESTSRWFNGSVFIEFYPNDSHMTVYVSARITSSEDYAQPAAGVKNEQDLLKLCKLVNGV